MARGRMLNNEISDSVKFQSLPDDTCRLLATWTIAHLDKNGVFHAEPALVRSKVFPWRDDITIPQIAGYLDAMEAAGLIERFQADGHTWQVWPGFADNQPGLHTERERTRYAVPPNAAALPDTAGELPESGGETPATSVLNSNTNNNPTQQEDNNNTGASAPVAAACGPDAVLALLLDYGIGAKNARKVANTPLETVEAVIADVDGRTNVTNRPGLVYAMLRDGADPPSRASPPDGSWQHFERSKYADFFEH